MAGVYLTGWSVHLPGECAEAVPADRAMELLGRRGLLYKEPATRLALCAVHRALGLPAKVRPEGAVRPDTAVVACGNLGNVETVAQAARAVAAGQAREVSPLAAPNASSNVVASTVARWFRFGGPNLMVCSGATAGLDGFALGGLLLRSGRARRVVLVGAEPADEVATRLYRCGAPATPLRAGAACVVLALAPGRPAIRVREAPGYPKWPDQPDRPALVFGGADGPPPWGDCYGAQGVVGLATAARWLAEGGAGPVGVVCGDPADGWRAVTVAGSGDG
ncbi:beta-ketoacyl synthase N-terminal-like domain-containing protein [Micromonospora sp. CPCC 206061]|uniref:beta-ketoacyl synthase N-terminal-like domain-containing protein n=1 Tax=Micromonospora sp. CPCC 206061 TaxID=3122410 RepID=UPI002FF2D645